MNSRAARKERSKTMARQLSDEKHDPTEQPQEKNIHKRNIKSSIQRFLRIHKHIPVLERVDSGYFDDPLG